MVGEITPPQAVPNQFLQQQQLQSHASQVQDIQNLVSKLPVGAQIVAQVTGADKNGNLTVRAVGSDLLLSSPIALAKGAELTLKITGTSSNVAFELLSVNGKLPPTQAQTVSNQLLPNPAIFLKPVAYGAVNGEVVPRQITPLTQSNPQPAAPINATAISQQAVVLSNPTTNLAQGVVLSPAPDALKILRNSISAALPADLVDEAIAKLPPNINSGSKIDFKITDIQLPQTPQITPAEDGVDTQNQVLKPQEFLPKIIVTPDGTTKLTAQVVALSGGQAVVDTALGRVVIANQFDANRVQIGSVLNLNIQQFIPEEIALQQSTIKDLFSEWPALKALSNALAQAGQAEHMNKLAGLDSAFVSRLAGFFKAVKENNIDNWLSSDLLRDLDPDSADAIKAKLTGDFANLTKLYHDNASTGWNTVLFPVYDGKELHQSRFYVKDLHAEEEKTSGKRFVVELTTGAFGDVQLDGLVRKNAAQNRFDLMVRTGNQLPEDVRMGITEIFNNSAQVTGIKGSVDFGNLDSHALRPASAVLAQQMDHAGWEA